MNLFPLESKALRRAALCASMFAALSGVHSGRSAPAPQQDPLDLYLTPIGRHANGPPFNTSQAEISAHDPATQRLFVVNAQATRVDVLDIHNPANPVAVGSIDCSPYGAVVNSVATHGGWIAVAVEAAPKTAPGKVVLLDSSLNVVSVVAAGSLPDMVTFSPDGRWVLVANEGEPNSYNNFDMSTIGPSVDPEGSITIIDLSTGVATPTVRTATFTAFNSGPLPPGLRIYGPNATVAQDLEPEYIAISEDSTTAWVTLQENNALAIVNIAAGVVTELVPLGYKDHSLPGYGLDASDQDGGINIQPWPVRGMFQPDGIAAYGFQGETYLVTANEGEARDWPGFREDVRLSTRQLDPAAFPNGAFLKQTGNLGRLNVSSLDGDFDHDGDLDAIYCYGGRSFTIWSAAGQLVFDSGDQVEQITAALFPLSFNCTTTSNARDNRSPAKGPEPEGVAIGKAYGRTLAFIGFERIGGIAVYNISDPHDVSLVDYVNTRDFTNPFDFATGGDISPEGVLFISADDSPNGKPLVVATHEVSGSTVIYQVNKKNFKGLNGDR